MQTLQYKTTSELKTCCIKVQQAQECANLLKGNSFTRIAHLKIYCLLKIEMVSIIICIVESA